MLFMPDIHYGAAYAFFYRKANFEATKASFGLQTVRIPEFKACFETY